MVVQGDVRVYTRVEKILNRITKLVWPAKQQQNFQLKTILNRSAMHATEQLAAVENRFQGV